MKRIFVAGSIKLIGHSFLHELTSEIQRHGFDVLSPSSVYADSDSPLIENIRKCGFVLGVIAGNDPNVYFEIGFAMGARKPVLLVTSPNITLPFDLRSVNCIIAEALSDDTILRVVDHLKRQQFDEESANTAGRYFMDVLNLYRDDPREFDAVDSEEFERCVMEWFVHKGKAVDAVGASKDSGYDLAVKNFGNYRSTLVEIKKQNISSKVSVVQVRALLGVVYAEGADHGILISASDFTRSAYEFAERCEPRIELWTMEQLLDSVD